MEGGAEGNAEIVIVAVVDIGVVPLVGADGVDDPVGLGAPLEADGGGIKAGVLVNQHGAVGVVVALLKEK